MQGIGRFVSPLRLVLALGLIGVSVLWAGRSLLSEHAEPPVAALLISGTLLLFGLGLLLTVFPYGCSSCKVALRDLETTFPRDCYERLNQCLVQGNAPALWELRIEAKDETHYSQLALEYCPRCEKVGRGQALVRHYDGEFIETEQRGPRVAVDAEFIATALEVTQKRAEA